MDSIRGLTQAEVEVRQKQYGLNAIVHSGFRTRIPELKKVLLDPMGLMLLALSGLYAAVGQRTDAWILLGAYFPILAVDVVLEIRAHRALRALRGTLQARAKVIRDGRVAEIPVQFIVPDDLLVFEEGQILPADGIILEARSLLINEAALTGESLPVEKGENSDFFAGTTVLQGHGLGRVLGIGSNTRYGRIASLLSEALGTETPLQRMVRRIVHRVLWGAAFLSVLLMTLQLLRGAGVIPSLMGALTFGMSAVPEEFPLVFTLYLSMGAYRLSKRGVLVKSLPAVETLGRVDVLCTDKTGTLTEGRFRLEELLPFDEAGIPENLEMLARLACEPQPVDALEQAIDQAVGPAAGRAIASGWELTVDYPFEPDGKHMSHVWRRQQGAIQILVMKGAVEGVLQHCQLHPEERERILRRVDHLSDQGKRVLGIACREGRFTGVREEDEKALRFCGFLVFSDPIRESARSAIADCLRAGIRLKMLTGDHPFTARSVAAALGIPVGKEELFTGAELAQSSEDARVSAYLSGVIFARVLPEQKYEMVRVLRERGLVVAMMGDGINDAPALRLADIGISMGPGATDVARSSAGMVLLRNDFEGVVRAVFEGRRIFSNLRRSFSYLISFHIPVALLSLIPPMMGWGSLLLPVHIVLLELIVHPVSAFTFENLDVPESGAERGLIHPRRLLESVASGVCLSLASLAFYQSRNGGGEAFARASGFAVLLSGNLFFVWNETGTFRRPRLWISVFFLFFIGGIVFHTQLSNRWFHFGSLGIGDLALALLLGSSASLPALLFRKIKKSADNWCLPLRCSPPRKH